MADSISSNHRMIIDWEINDVHHFNLRRNIFCYAAN